MGIGIVCLLMLSLPVFSLRLSLLQVVRFMRVIIGVFFAWLRGAMQPSQLELYKHFFDL